MLLEVCLSQKKKTLKILHGGSQDIEIFIKNKINIKPFFDTQVAAGFLGIDKNISYANIVKKYLNKKLDKTHQSINWLKRPMSKSQINYLKNDVLHLKEIYNLQNKALKKFKKLDFVNEEFNLIYDNIKNNNGINSKFKKKLVHQIYKNRQFYKFLKIREEKSKIKDLPKNWVLKDEDIIKIIKTKKLALLEIINFFQIMKRET